jgi:hypothetical protein
MIVRVMDEETKALLVKLRASPTDLARLIERLSDRREPAMVVPRVTVAAWETRAPEAWRVASAWLAQRKIPIIIIPPASGDSTG